MKRILSAMALSLFALAAQAGQVKYDVVQDQSTLGFTYSLGGADVKGNFPDFDAEIGIDFESVSNSRIAVTINAETGNAGLALATPSMLGESVLNVAKFPTIRFISQSVSLGTHPEIIVSGDLTVRGVTKPLSFTATLIVEDKEQFELKEKLRVRLDAKFLRSVFGASGFGDLVKDEMKLEADITISKAL